MTPRPLSVQLYSVRDALAADRPGTLHRLAAHGFTVVEPFDVGDGGDGGDGGDPVAAAVALRDDLAAAGLVARWAHAVAPLDEAAAPVLDAAEALGLEVLVVPAPACVPGFTPDAFGSAATTTALGERLAEAAAAARARGLRFAYHNHWWEFTPLPDGRLPYDVLVAAAGPDVELEVDVYWAEAGGTGPADLVGAYGPRVTALHLKDGPARYGEPQLLVGEGVVDVPGAIAAGTYAQWHVMEFDDVAGDPVEMLAASARRLVDAGTSTFTPPWAGTDG